MLPEFPKFKKLEISDKKDIEIISDEYPPYSDFNFISMWAWNINDDLQVSQLNNNLIVRFTDYLSGAKFYSFLGNHKVNETSDTLLEFSKKQGIKPVLRLVPEEAVKSMDRNKFNIVEEPNHFDYIYSIKNIADYIGSEYKKHRKMTRRFKDKHEFEVQLIDLTEEKNKKLLRDLVDQWSKNKKEKADTTHNYKELDDLKNESIAFDKLLSSPTNLLQSLVCFAIFVEGKLASFILSEKLSNNYCLSHFGKANTAFEGISQFLMQAHANLFLDMGIHYHNDEQDLGLTNLRFSKNSYRPEVFLKKYSIAFMDDFVI